jgi:hypothetical protein
VYEVEFKKNMPRDGGRGVLATREMGPTTALSFGSARPNQRLSVGPAGGWLQ